MMKMTAQGNTFDRLEQSGADFLITDSELALTLTKIAAGAGDDLDKRQRNQQNARNAYDSVIRFRERWSLTEAESAELDNKLRELKSALENLGEVFDAAA